MQTQTATTKIRPSKMLVLTPHQKAVITKARDKAFADMPAKVECPRCENKRPKAMFGIRTFRNSKGEFVRAAPQSLCTPCRNGKVDKKGKAASKAVKTARKVAAKAPKAKAARTKVKKSVADLIASRQAAIVSSEGEGSSGPTFVPTFMDVPVEALDVAAGLVETAPVAEATPEPVVVPEPVQAAPTFQTPPRRTFSFKREHSWQSIIIEVKANETEEQAMLRQRASEEKAAKLAGLI